jgi:hypothetical protein
VQEGAIVEGMKWPRTPRFRSSYSGHHGFIPNRGRIAHVKEVHGIPTLREANRARGSPSSEGPRITVELILRKLSEGATGAELLE